VLYYQAWAGMTASTVSNGPRSSSISPFSWQVVDIVQQSVLLQVC